MEKQGVWRVSVERREWHITLTYMCQKCVLSLRVPLTHKISRKNRQASLLMGMRVGALMRRFTGFRQSPWRRPKRPKGSGAAGASGRSWALFCEELFRSHDGDGAGLNTQGTARWIVGTNRLRLKTDPRTRLTASVDLSVRDLNVLRSHLYFQELLLELSSGCRHCCRSPLSLLKLRLLCRLRSVHTISAGEA